MRNFLHIARDTHSYIHIFQEGVYLTKPVEQKAQFIELRAQGQSYSKIADTLQISKSTCTAWARELEAEIAERERERLEELYTLYSMHKTSRIERLGEMLERIDTALAAKNLEDLPADKLLELKLKYARELKAEYMEPAQPIQENTLDAVLVQYKAILERSVTGQATPAQTSAQLAAIGGTLKVMKDIDNRDSDIFYNGSL